MIESKKDLKIMFFLFLMFTAFYMIFIPGNTGSDGYEIYLTTKNLVEHGKINVAKEDLGVDIPVTRFGFNTADKQYYSKYGVFSSILMTPFYLFGLFVSKITRIDTVFITKVCVNFFNCFITALLLAFMYLFSRILRYSVKVSVGVSLLLGFTTMLWAYAVESFSEPLAFLLLLLSMIFIVLYRDNGKNAYICWSVVFMSLAVLTKIYYAAFIIPLVIYFVMVCIEAKDIKKFLSGALAGFLTALPFIILAFLSNKIKSNDYLNFGYINLGNKVKPVYGALDYITGIYGHFLSAGKSSFLYNPVIILSLFAINDFYKKHKNEAVMFLNLLIMSLILFAPIAYWQGGICWGSRYMYPLIPVMMLLTGEVISNDKFAAIKKNILPFLIIMGILIQIPSVMSGYFYWYDVMKKCGIGEERMLFTPRYSPLAGSVIIFGSMIKHTAGFNSSEIAVKNDESQIKVNISEYDHISPCWLRALSGKIVKYNKEIINISAGQRAVIIIWLMFLIFVVIFSMKKLKRTLLTFNSSPLDGEKAATGG